MSLTLLYLFIPTFFIVSITPGMCMTLALSLGLSIGIKRSLYMMWGELIGVGFIEPLQWQLLRHWGRYLNVAIP